MSTQANPSQGPTIAQCTLDEMQRTLDVQADQIRELARVLHQHDMLHHRDLAQFEPRREGSAT